MLLRTSRERGRRMQGESSKHREQRNSEAMCGSFLAAAFNDGERRWGSGHKVVLRQGDPPHHHPTTTRPRPGEPERPPQLRPPLPSKSSQPPRRASAQT
eukprot:4909811-Prymnesium_polylepis.1